MCVIPIMEMLFIHQLRKSRFRVLCWHPGVKPRTNHEVATPSTDEVMVVFAKKKHIGLVNYYQFTSVYSNIDQFRPFFVFLLKQETRRPFSLINGYFWKEHPEHFCWIAIGAPAGQNAKSQRHLVCTEFSLLLDGYHLDLPHPKTQGVVARGK